MSDDALSVLLAGKSTWSPPDGVDVVGAEAVALVNGIMADPNTTVILDGGKTQPGDYWHREQRLGAPAPPPAGPLEPDRDLIEIFINALFRYTEPRSYVSLRSFRDDRDGAPPFRIHAIQLTGGLPFLVDAAVDDARRAAQAPHPVVFCPPIATFGNSRQAGEKDLAQGIALSVELDEHAQGSRAKLETMLGPATVVVASGGRWVDPATGESGDKLHAHWRLAKPAQGEAAFKQLKQARRLATAIVGGDPTSIPAVHPLRWPGSWHRKADPRMCRIEAVDPDREIDLAAALDALTTAAPKLTRREPSGDGTGYAGGSQTDWAEPIANIAAGRNVHASIASLAMKMLRSGMQDGAAVNQLRALMEASSAPRDARWQARYDDICRAVSTAREKVAADARAAMAAAGPAEGDEIDYLADDQIDLEPPPDYGPPPGEGEHAMANDATESRRDNEPPIDTMHFHGDAEVQIVRNWTIKNLMTEQGAGLLSGQWGTYKTTLALDLAAAIMRGPGHFFAGLPVKRQGGVLFIPVDGLDEFPIRLQAVVEARCGNAKKMPLAWDGSCPPLLGSKTLGILTAMAKKAADRLQRDFGLPLALIVIDTWVVAAGYTKSGEDNDTASTQKILALMFKLSRATGAYVVGIDHFGKNLETGIRGSGNKESSGDLSLIALGDKDPSGRVTNTRLCIRKRRHGPNGVEIPYTVEIVDLGRDEDGDPVTSVVAKWTGDAVAAAASTKPAAKDTGWSTANLKLLQRALMNMTADVGTDLRPFGDGPMVRAVTTKVLRDEFYRSFPSKSDDPAKRAEARRRAFNRALDDANERQLIGTREIDDTDYVWLAKIEPASLTAGATKAAATWHVTGQTPPGTYCAQCHSDTPTVLKIAADQVGAKAEPLHEACADKWFSPTTR
jgi:hypothetical protein